MQAFATEAGIGIGTLQRWETQQPRTNIHHRGLDPLRVAKVLAALSRLENGAG